MKIAITVELVPFPVPATVLGRVKPRLACPVQPPHFLLEDLDEATLDALCVQFRKDVFLKAKKRDPDITKVMP